MTATLVATMVLASLAATGGLRTAIHAQPGPSTKTVWTGVYTKEQAARGEAVYATHCRSCHGPSLEGGEMAPALAGPMFLATWDGLTVGDLFDRTRTTMPLDNPGSISRAQLTEVTAHMLRVNEFPAGETELEASSEVLKQILIRAYKPEPRPE